LGRSLDDLDALDGPAFEEWIAAVLGEAGWCVVRTPHGSDFGVDLIASKDGMRIGIEAKRRSGRISNAVIRSVVAGCQYHDCAVAAVVTQSTFTAQARRQAAASNLPVMLVGRNDLTRLCALMASGPFLREGNGG
jgi:restriction system protein